MEQSDKIPPPVLFNLWKHHSGYIIRSLKESALLGTEAYYSLGKKLHAIGSSQADLYTGKLTPFEIAAGAREYILNTGLTNAAEYSLWLYSEGKRYREFEIQDGSRWTLLMGNDPERYLHIHPSRYSPHSIRVKAASLKTAAAAISCSLIFDLDPFDTEVINRARKEVLGECPVRSAESSPGLVRIIKLLTDNLV